MVMRVSHGGYGFGTRNEEGERILEFSEATGMVVGNTLFKKRESQLVTYESGKQRSAIDFLLIRKEDRVLLKNV